MAYYIVDIPGKPLGKRKGYFFVRIMSNFKKAFNLIIIAIFMWQNIGFCLPDENPTLRPPLTTSKTAQEWLGLSKNHKEVLAKLDEYLKIEEEANDPDRDTTTIEEMRNIEGSVQILVDVMKKDSRTWMRAKAASALGSLYDFKYKEIISALFEQLSQDESVMVRSIIARKSLPEIKESVSKKVAEEIERHIRNADLNPWPRENALKVLDAGCCLGEATNGMASYYRDKGFVDTLVVGVDPDFPSIIEAERNKKEPNVIFILGNLDTDDFGKADIVISKNLLLYDFEIPVHAKILKRHLNLNGGTIYYSPSLFSDGQDGVSTLWTMERELERLFPKAKHKKYGGYKSEVYNPFGFDITEPVFDSAWPNSAGWVETQLPSKVTVKSGEDLIKVRISNFPDGEFYIRVLNPGAVNDADITVTTSLDNADDLVKAVLLMDTLRRYDARNIKLVMDKPHEIVNGLDRMLRYFCDAIEYIDESGLNRVSLDVEPLEPVEKAKQPSWISQILYQHSRLEHDVKYAAAEVNAQSERIKIDKTSSNPLEWKVDLPHVLHKINVVLVHTTENNTDIAELWAMLIALREGGVKSLSVISAYNGYSRQDKEFSKGEGISAETMVRASDILLDYNMGLNIHYADQSGLFHIGGYNIHNLNSFIQVAENLFDIVVRWEGKDNIKTEFSKHPILLVGPDEGAFGYVKEARDQLEHYIKDNYGIKLPVHWGYMDKERLGGKKVKISPRILGVDDQPIKGVVAKDCWVFVLDDETSWGTTLFASDYALVRKAGIPWHRVLAGVVHGKLAQGLKPFETGWTQDDIIKALEKGEAVEPKPEYINEKEELMPPRLFICTRSVSLPDGFPEENSVSLGPIVAFAIKRLIGQGRVNMEERWKRENLKVVLNEREIATYKLNGETLVFIARRKLLKALIDLGWITALHTTVHEDGSNSYGFTLNKDKIDIVAFSGDYAETKTDSFLKDVDELKPEQKAVLITRSSEQEKSLMEHEEIKRRLGNKIFIVTLRRRSQADRKWSKLLGNRQSYDFRKMTKVKDIIDDQKLIRVLAGAL